MSLSLKTTSKTKTNHDVGAKAPSFMTEILLLTPRHIQVVNRTMQEGGRSHMLETSLAMERPALEYFKTHELDRLLAIGYQINNGYIWLAGPDKNPITDSSRIHFSTNRKGEVTLNTGTESVTQGPGYLNEVYRERTDSEAEMVKEWFTKLAGRDRVKGYTHYLDHTSRQSVVQL